MSIFKNLGNLAGIMKQAQEMSARMQSANQELKTRRVYGTAGGNMVSVEANGQGQILRLSIDPEFFSKMDRELLEDLVPAAVNQAVAKAKELQSELMQGLTQGVEIPPGLAEMFSQSMD